MSFLVPIWLLTEQKCSLIFKNPTLTDILYFFVLFKKVKIMQKKKLLDIVRDKIRVKHYSVSTERTYVYWIKYYILFHNKTHPINMGKAEIEEFLTYLAVNKKVSPTTQNQAFSAILFLYRDVLSCSTSPEVVHIAYINLPNLFSRASWE